MYKKRPGIFGSFIILFLLMNSTFYCEVSNEEVNAQNSLKLTIKSDKQEYEINDDIYIDLKITNKSDSIITVCNLLIFPSKFLDFNIVDLDSNKSIYPNFHEDLFGHGRFFVKLLKNAFVGRRINLNKSEFNEPIMFKLKKAGRYQIEAIYSIPKSWANKETPLLSKLWTGELTSNKIIIDVK